MNKIKFACPSISNIEISNIKKILKSKWIISGQEELKIEKKLKKKFKKRFCVLFNSWTSAAYTLFFFLKNKKHSEVLMPSLSFIATANAPYLAGHNIRFCDVDLETFNLNINYIKKKITKKTKIILTVDQLGNPCDLKSIASFAKQKGIKLVHDAACSFGSKIGNSNIGLESDYLLLSFHARKLVTSGEGGALLTNDNKIYTLSKLFRSHGMDKNTYFRSKSKPSNYENYLINGLNFKFNDLQASLLNSQIKRSKNFLKQRNKIKNFYDKYFSRHKDKIIIQKKLKNSQPNNQSYMIILKSKNFRDDLIKYLHRNKIETRKAVTAMHQEGPFKKKFKNLKLTNSEFIAQNGIQLPMHFDLTLNECKKVIFYINKFLKLKKIL